MGDVTSITKYDEPLVKAEVVAQFLGLEPPTVLRMARNGEIPALKIGSGGGRQWRFRMSDIKDWIQAQADQRQATIPQGTKYKPRKKETKAS